MMLQDQHSSQKHFKIQVTLLPVNNLIITHGVKMSIVFSLHGLVKWCAFILQMLYFQKRNEQNNLLLIPLSTVG